MPVDDNCMISGSGGAMTTKFERKRQAILDAATEIINRHGVKGLTFVAVAERIGLRASSVAYYFRRKEALASACFERTLQRIEAIVAVAEGFPTPRQRVAAYIDAYIRIYAAMRAGEAPALAILSDMRALDAAAREPVMAHYARLFARIRGFWGAIGSERERLAHGARALMLAEAVYWFPVTLEGYFVEDFPRVGRCLKDLFGGGLAANGAAWRPVRLVIEREAAGAGRDFLRASTRLINERGYRGASVERIAAELHVTKGSFYHHLEAKDALILQCFRLSYAAMRRAQMQAEVSGGSALDRVAAAVESLLGVQMSGDWPLMRTTALQTLPEDLRDEVLRLSERATRHFTGLLSDGIAEGSVRPVDPVIAGQVVMSSINAAVELRLADRSREGVEGAVALYAALLAHGLFEGFPED